MNTIQKRMRYHLDELEKVLREADDAYQFAYQGEKRQARKVRCAINDACNALHRGVNA